MSEAVATMVLVSVEKASSFVLKSCYPGRGIVEHAGDSCCLGCGIVGHAGDTCCPGCDIAGHMGDS